ncbi:FGGY-family carbohydrate kinase [Curtobacterium sp. NPDC090217]|uniref:FGGY-family carbohydrate kinase n=1 Tax=Curtobacterium sp. NPDC090217 TaxID=3363970 RepID=UPI00381D3416
MWCTLGFDVGTSSSKGVLVDQDGTVVGTAVRVHEVDRPAVGHVEQDPRVWWDEFVAVTRELLTAHPDVEVVAVGVSGMGPCLALADEYDEPVRPAVLYGVDTRAVEEIAALTAELGAGAITRIGGSALTTQAVGPKLEWVAVHEPDVFGAARRMYMPASWIVRRLTGAYVLDHHSASQCTPLYDIGAHAWHRPWTDRIAQHVELPELLWAGDHAGDVTTAGADATGLPAGVPVVCGTIDAWAEAASVGALREGDLMLMYGTTMFLVATVTEPIRTPSMWTTLGLRDGVSCLAGGMATSGAVAAWVRDLAGGGRQGGPDFGTLTEEARASGPGANGLLMLPYFAGERTPIMDPDARGVVAGLTLSTSRGDLYRAALEATAHGVRHNVDTMRDAGADIRRIVAAGGGTQGGLWIQIVSDTTGLDQVVPRTTVGAAYGMAWTAACARATAAGVDAPDIDEWNPAERVVVPDPTTRDRYDADHQRFLDLYAATAPIVHDLVATERATRTRAAAITADPSGHVRTDHHHRLQETTR